MGPMDASSSAFKDFVMSLGSPGSQHGLCIESRLSNNLNSTCDMNFPLLCKVP